MNRVGWGCYSVLGFRETSETILNLFLAVSKTALRFASSKFILGKAFYTAQLRTAIREMKT